MIYDLTKIETELLAKISAISAATKTTEMLVLAKTASELTSYGGGGATLEQSLLNMLLDPAITGGLLTDYLAGNDYVLSGVFYGGVGVTAATNTFNDIVTTSSAMAAIIASPTAMAAIIASTTAMAAVIASPTAMAAIIASPTAMAAVIASPTAMAAVIASTTAMAAIVSDAAASTSIETALQPNRAALLATLADTSKFSKITLTNVCQNALTTTVGAATNSVYIPISAENGSYLQLHSLLTGNLIRDDFTTTPIVTWLTLRGTKVTSDYTSGHASIHMTFDVYTVI